MRVYTTEELRDRCWSESMRRELRAEGHAVGDHRMYDAEEVERLERQPEYALRIERTREARAINDAQRRRREGHFEANEVVNELMAVVFDGRESMSMAAFVDGLLDLLQQDMPEGHRIRNWLTLARRMGVRVLQGQVVPIYVLAERRHRDRAFRAQEQDEDWAE